MPTTLYQVAVPSTGSIIDFGFVLGALAVLFFFLVKAYRDRNNSPAAPYVGQPYIAITLAILVVVMAGGSLPLDSIVTPMGAVIFGFIIKAFMMVLVWPFWVAGLLIIPAAHIFPKLQDAIKAISK